MNNVNDLLQLLDEIVKEDGLSPVLEQKLLEEGFTTTVTDRGRGVCSSFVSTGCDYVFMFLNNARKGVKFPLLIDKSTYFDIGAQSFYLKDFHGGTDYAPIMKVGLLHTIVCRCEKPFEVDHITTSTNICIKESLRPVSKKQNIRHKYKHTKWHGDNGLHFEAKFLLTEAQVAALKRRGYTIKPEKCKGDYRVISQVYLDKTKMFDDINKLERELLGEYRYDPLVSCDTNKSMYLYMIWKLFGISDEIYYKAKKQLFIIEKGTEMAQYYGLN